MTDAPSTEAVRQSERFGRLADAVEMIAEWGFASHEQLCTHDGYDTQAILYPRQALDAARRRVHSAGMVIPLKQARETAGMSQERLAQAVDSGRSTIVKLEKGVLPMTEEWAKRLAPALGLRASDLYKGPQVRVIGYVGAGQRVYAYDDMLYSGETIDQPPMTSGDLVSVEVKGDSMLPLAEEGWHIVYTAEATVDENEVIGRVCVVQLDDDGSMLVKRVIRGSIPYHYHLVSMNAAAIENVRLRWAAVVKAIVPR
jgi:DNA-binding XRE family transcriptional regulator